MSNDMQGVSFNTKWHMVIQIELNTYLWSAREWHTSDIHLHNRSSIFERLGPHMVTQGPGVINWVHQNILRESKLFGLRSPYIYMGTSDINLGSRDIKWRLPVMAICFTYPKGATVAFALAGHKWFRYDLCETPGRHAYWLGPQRQRCLFV